MFHILVVDDDKNTRRFLQAVLEGDNYAVSLASNGEEALTVLDREHIDLVVLDIMMPKMDGYEFTKTLRDCGDNLPILMISAKHLPEDKRKGFLVGTDDYITKPFNPVEVAARVRSQLRRYLQLGGREIHSDSFVIGGIELNDRTKEVTLDGESVALTPKEYEILKLLMANPDKVFSPKEIYRQVWNEQPISSERTVAVHIRHLREKIEINPAEPRYLKVVFGQGYKMEKGKRI